MIFHLSVPPSVNNCFAGRINSNRRYKSQAYRSWIDGELRALVAQRAKPAHTPVAVSITLPFGTKGDVDNRTKPVLDLLVRAGILPDDNSKHVTSVYACYGAVETMQVELRAG